MSANDALSIENFVLEHIKDDRVREDRKNKFHKKELGDRNYEQSLCALPLTYEHLVEVHISQKDFVELHVSQKEEAPVVI